MALPVGKLPPELLARLLGTLPVTDARVLVRAGPGLDCAVIAPQGDGPLLVVKSDPITFASQEMAWYLVQVNANDLATSGAQPRWLLVTALLPEGATTAADVEHLFEELTVACSAFEISLVGGHTEVTAGLARPLLIGTLLGEVPRGRLITPAGAQPGDRVLLTKGVPIEATALLAREFPDRLRPRLTEAEIEAARGYLHAPGLSIVRDAALAAGAGRVTAMHDPTEGGLAAAVWELAEASGRAIEIDINAVPVPELAARVCAAFSIDPMSAIASGALLLTTPASDAGAIRAALAAAGLACAEIGSVAEGPAAVWARTRAGRRALARPGRDAVAHLFARA